MIDLDYEALSAPPPAPLTQAACVSVRNGASSAGSRAVPEETAVAFTFGGSTHAVMMATPDDFEDFAYGFAFTEGLIEDAAEVENFEILSSALGVELRLSLPREKAERYAARRRSMAGPTGCGLCGVESLGEAMRPAPVVTVKTAFDGDAVADAMASLAGGQTLNARTRAVHAAGFWTPSRGLVAVREDVGRHNALDKLAGALLRAGDVCRDGLVLLTSRVSIELIQKAARMGAPVVVAISVPTAAAIRLAQECGVTLVAVARGRDFEIFTHAARVIDRASAHVA